MRFMRLPFLMIIIALAASVSTQFEYLLRFGAMALATLTLMGAFSDLQRNTRTINGMLREDLLKLWFGSKLREQHTWEHLNTQVHQTASALRLPPPPRPALPAPNPSSNGARSKNATSPLTSANQPAPEGEAKPARPPLGPFVRLLALETLSEAIVIATILLNWFLPVPGTTGGEQLALLLLSLIALGLLWFDWRLLRRFVAAFQTELARLSPQTSTSATSTS
jgi:hypothetical protein